MRLSILFALGAAFAPVLAQLPANYTGTYEYSVTDQSADFNLVVQSKNKTLNGALLGACHDGAAAEGLCLVDFPINSTDDYVKFQWNTTQYICINITGTGNFSISCGSAFLDPTQQTGSVTWWLDYNVGTSSQGRVSQVLNLVTYLWSNVALSQFGFPSCDGCGGVQVAFDKNNLMNIQEIQDDTKEPGNEYPYVYNVTSTAKALYRWYICETLYSDYHYTTLTWVLGLHSPQNPTCSQVNVERVFV